MIANTVSHFAKHPKQLMWVDAAGALVSGGLTIGLVRLNPQWFGISASWCWPFGIIAAFLCLVSSCSALLFARKPRLPLLLIASGNFMYMVFVVGSLAIGSLDPTPLGLLFLAGEMAILVCLIWLEWKVANRCSRNRNN